MNASELGLGLVQTSVKINLLVHYDLIWIILGQRTTTCEFFLLLLVRGSSVAGGRLCGSHYITKLTTKDPVL